MKKSKVQIIIGGAGGQGILTAGKVLSYACIKSGLEVSCLPAYGAEMRGGYVYCILTISNSEDVFSPISSECDVGIFLNEKSFHMLSSYLKQGALIFLNSSLIKNKNKKAFEFPATEEAEKIGDGKVANMIFVGALTPFIKKMFNKFRKEDILWGVEKLIRNEKLKDLSKKAIERGLKLLEPGSEKWEI